MSACPESSRTVWTLASTGRQVYHRNVRDVETVDFSRENKDVRTGDGKGTLSVIEGISLARSSSRNIPRAGSVSMQLPEPGPASISAPSVPPAPFRSFSPAGYAFESDDDLLGPEEFGPIVFRDGIFQIDGTPSPAGSGLDPKLKQLIDSILDPTVREQST